MLAALLLAAACSNDGDAAPASTTSTTTTTTPTLDLDSCADAADDAIVPLQAFIEEHQDLTVEEWNAILPPPSAQPAQDEMIAIAQAAVEQGCDASAMEEMLAERIAGLTGEGEVGRAIAAALRGDGPILGPPLQIAPSTTVVTRDDHPSTVTLAPGDDLNEVLATIGFGSTVEFAAGVHSFEEPIVVDVDVTFRGAGLAETVLSSKAEGVAVAFVGPGGFAVEDMTIEHVGELEASVLLTIEGPLRVSRTELRGGVAGTDAAGGGHGLVFAFEQLPGFPERTDVQRIGRLVVEDSRIVSNAAAGVLITGGASPTIERTTVEGNGGCGVCYAGRGGGVLRDSEVTGNLIGVQASSKAFPVVDATTIKGNRGAGVSTDESANVTVFRSEISDNGDVGVQAIGESRVVIEHTTLVQHGVGVLAAGTSNVRLADNNFAAHDTGIQVGGQARLDAERNVLRENLSAAISYGEDSLGRAVGNDVASAPDAGIQALGRSAPEILRNTVTGGGAVGVSVVDESTATVSGNEVRNRDVGIQVGGSARPVVADNTVLDSTAVAILFGDQAGGRATANRVTSREAVGILVGGSAAPRIENNEVLGNGVGIVYRDQAAGVARGNNVRDHVIGVQIVDGSAPLVIMNHVEGSVEAGAAFTGTTTARFEQNTLVSNGNLSIQVAGQAAPDLAGNEIRGAGIYGVLYRDAARGMARDNRVINHVYGIQLDDSAAPTITGNSFEEVPLTSILYGGSTGGSASGNHCSQTFVAGISIADNANPTLGTNECTVSRSG